MDNKQILSEIIVQILGFLVIFAILKRFAWSKLLGVIDARRRTIDDAFTDIERRKKGLDALEQEYRRKIDRIEEEARAKIQEAAREGSRVGKDIQDQARAEAGRLIALAKAGIEQDLAKARLAMRDEIVEISSLMMEKILREKLDAKDHERLVDQFLKDLERVG